ncbi:MAG: efflux RND transporter periplasmic adaptor subunit [Leptolyngbya sp. SIO1D8]|nr:efflux RND transporter periplasmic adaptor subunit [Leptolyngbya sp. SIO1D8]
MKAQVWTRLKPISPWLGGLIVAVGLGAIAWVYLQQRQGTTPDPLEEQTVLVEHQNLTPQILAGGVVQAERTINLSPENSGKIADLFVQEGDFVTQGQVIARMTSRQNQAEVDQYQAALAQAEADLAQKRAGPRSEEIAEARARVEIAQASVEATQAQLEKAQAELTRFQQLAEQGAVSANELGTYLTTEQETSANLVANQQQLEESQAALTLLLNGTRAEEIVQAEASVTQAEAQLQAVQVQLDETIVRAPFDGIITRRFAEAGDFVTPNTAASSDDGASSTSIAELSSGLEIEAKVPEANIAKLRVGQAAEVRSNAYPDQVFTGEIKLIAPRAIRDNEVTVFRVKVNLTTGQDLLKSGMNIRLTFLGSPVEDALVIPLAAVVTQPDGETGVYLSDVDNPAASTFQPIQIGITTGAQVQVIEGLNLGDRILIEPPSDQKIEGVDTVGF